MIEFNILTIFPDMLRGLLEESMLKRAIEAGHVRVNLINFRDYTLDKHRRVDDAPFGGGAGMLIMPQPVFDCFAAVAKEQDGKRVLNVYMSPAGDVLNAGMSREIAEYDAVNILCGHYEGVDQRIIDELIDREISIGDYVLTGGELPAMVLLDSVMRHIPGVLGNAMSTEDESHSAGLLEYPQYTRPSDFRGLKVPEVLLSGQHANIVKGQREKAIEKTRRVRPDLLKNME